MGGAGQLKTGASGKDLILDVPCGTEIYTEDMSIKIHEILKDDETYHFLRGGQGGKGNAHFKVLLIEHLVSSNKEKKDKSQLSD